MIFGLGFMLLGGFALYFAITGADPIDAFRRALIGAAPPAPLPTGRRAEAGTYPGPYPATPPSEAIAGNKGTPQLQVGLAIALSVPGARLGTICGPGSVAGSEHPNCNAADIGGARSVLVAVFNALLIAARAGAPIHCIIGPSSRKDWPKGQIRSRESGWKPREYTGPNSHQTHVHFSGWPSVGGGC